MEPGYDVYEYSRKGQFADLRETLLNGGKPDLYMAYDGSTALTMACRGGHHQIVEELLRAKASVDIRTDDGSTILHHAVSGNSATLVHSVVAAGVDVNGCNEDKISPLMLAAHYGKVDVVEALVAAGADIHLFAEGWGTALDSATAPDVVAFLESRGAQRRATGQGYADQPVAAAGERFNYGCFESGDDPNAAAAKAAPVQAPAAAGASAGAKMATVGASVQLRKPKAGMLKEGDIGVVVDDDGSDCLPLKVKLGDAHDFYNHEDVEVCGPAVELPPDSDRATAEGTQRYFNSRKNKGVVCSSTLGTTGLTISPVGFGCHRINDEDAHKTALAAAVQVGCNLIDLAPNYTDGEAETVAGLQIQELISTGKVRRDELVIMTKVGNVLGKQLKHAEGVSNMTRVNDNLCHCISPEWIEQEITRSLQRLHLTCVDGLLLHCPEYETKAGVDMSEIYTRLQAAFKHLETEVARGRIAMYGISAAFYPLRPTDPEHLDLQSVIKQLPENHHFRVLQFPLNFAETQVLTVGHTARNPEGVAIDRELGFSSPTLFELTQKHGLATLTNRPLDGIYKESHGVLRFSSLDCDVRSFSELQLDNCDALEEKLTNMCELDEAPYNSREQGQLAEKTVKVLSSLEGVDCVLLGMRRPEYVVNTLKMALFSPPIPKEIAQKTTSAIHNTVSMWYATAIHEDDHGTAKDWRLPVMVSSNASAL